MSVEAIAAALPRRGLTPTQKLVLIGIANHDGDGGAWPSIATLAGYAECSERQVQRAVRDLEAMGLVTVHRQEGGTGRTPRGQRPNLYELHLRGDTQVTPTPDLDVTPGVTPVSPEPSSNRPENPSLSAGGRTAELPEAELFEALWRAYPRNPNDVKERARRAWRSMVRRGELDALRSTWSAWKVELASREPRHRPHVSTFLNQRYYEHAPDLSAPTGAVAGPPIPEQRAPIAAPTVADPQWSDDDWRRITGAGGAA